MAEKSEETANGEVNMDIFLYFWLLLAVVL